MERLKARNGFVLDNAINAYEHTADSALDRCTLDFLKELRDYRKAEEQGLLLRPKCRLGDVVYALWSIPTESKYVVYPAEVKEINLSSTNARKMIMYKLEPIAFRGRYNKYYDDDFGKLVFMTEEEAEQALKQMGE